MADDKLKMNAEIGWHSLTHTMAKTVPQRLAWSRRNRQALMQLTRGKKR